MKLLKLRILLAAATGVLLLSVNGGLAVAAPTLARVPVIIPRYYGDACSGTIISDSEESPNVSIVSATLNGKPVANADRYAFNAVGGDTAAVTESAAPGYVLPNGTRTQRVQVPNIPRPDKKLCNNKSPEAATINRTVTAGTTTYIDVFNPAQPLATDPDNDPLELLQVFNNSSFGTATIVNRRFSDGQTRQAIKYVAANKVGTDKGSYTVSDTYYSRAGDPYHHLVPANLKIVVTR